MLTLDWIIASIAQKKPADEKEFQYNRPSANCDKNEVSTAAAQPSPASKKNIQSMAHNFRKPISLSANKGRKLEFECANSNSAAPIVHADENALVSKYLEAPIERIASNTVRPFPGSCSPDPPTTGETECGYATSSDTQNLSFLIGLTVCVFGFETAGVAELKRQIGYAGGNIVDLNSTKIDYLVVPFDILTLPKVKSHTYINQTVNEFWFVSCMLSDSD